MNTSYLVLKELNIQNASSYNNFYCVGFPGVTSFSGFADAVCRRLSEVVGTPVTSEAFAVLVHGATHHDGMERHVRYMQGEKVADLASPPSMKQEHKCDMTVTVIIKTAYHGKATGWAKTSTDSLYTVFDTHQAAITDAVTSLRLAGGTITNDIFDEEIVLCKKHFLSSESVDSVENIVRKLSPGFFMASATPLFEEYMTLFDGDALRAITHACALYREQSEGDGRARYRRAQRGWITPSNIGYVGITEPTQVDGARSDTPLVYAEPLTGLVEYVFAPRELRKMKGNGMQDSRIFFSSSYQNNVYLVAA